MKIRLTLLRLSIQLQDDRIYPTELQLNRANSSDTEAPFFYLNLCKSNGTVSTKIYDKNSTEGVIAPAGAKVTGATIRTWLLNKFISFLAVLTWKTGLKKM